MDSQAIRDAITSDPALMALVPDTQAIADAMSVGRTKYGTISRAWFATWAAGTGMRAVIQDTANTQGHPRRSIALSCLDVLAGASDGIDLGNPANLGMIQAWVQAGLMTQADADALIALGTVPDPVSEFEVRRAIYNDDGSLAV
jgi:hypothetical protein